LRPVELAAVYTSAKFGKEAFHLVASVLIASANGSLDALRQDGFCFFRAIVPCECLRVHLVAGNIIRIALNQRLKVRLGGDEVTVFDALQSDAIAGEGVVWMLRQKIFQFLTAAFALFSHGDVSYYTCRTKNIQKARGSERWHGCARKMVGVSRKSP